jgi:hypothetical protein
MPKLPPWLVAHVDGTYSLVRAGELAVTTDTFSST